MRERGHFIVVEGLEGAGKSSAMAAIQQYLTAHVGEIILTREPGGTAVGEAIRQIIKHPPEDDCLDPKSELMLLYTSRLQLVEHVIKPALARGVWVLADRFELSTFAYQGGGRGLDVSMIEHLSAFCLQGFSPDLVLFLDVTPELGLQRAQMRGPSDRIEQESIDFFKAVSKAYHAKIKSMKQVVMIDANQPEALVKKAIEDALAQYIHEGAR
jgi:dTMP kinase